AFPRLLHLLLLHLRGPGGGLPPGLRGGRRPTRGRGHGAPRGRARERAVPALVEKAAEARGARDGPGVLKATTTANSPSRACFGSGPFSAPSAARQRGRNEDRGGRREGGHPRPLCSPRPLRRSGPADRVSNLVLAPAHRREYADWVDDFGPP